MAHVRVQRGSPPQVRGKRRRESLSADISRITPAGAGKTKATLNERFVNQDHPRRCGENREAEERAEEARGSPPQVRGKPMLSKQDLDAARITPAGAGKTLSIRHPAGAGRDHPRRCGENCQRVIVHLGQMGSPPQVRGKPIVLDSSMQARRITPAGAGKT